MKQRLWFGKAILLIACATFLLAVMAGPLYSQDRRRQVEPGADLPARQPLEGQEHRRGGNSANHRVEIARLSLPDDTHLTTPITLGLKTVNVFTGDGVIQPDTRVRYEHIILSGAISAQHDMIEIFKRNVGREYQLTITILSNTGEEIREFVAPASMVEVTLDLDTHTWHLEFAMSTEN